VDIALLVRAQPITVAERRLLLLLVHDVTVEQRRAALERTFFHDINNLLAGLLQSCEVLAAREPSDLTEMISDTARRLHGEVAIQRYLASVERGQYRATWRTCGARKIVAEIRRFFGEHPAARDRRLECETPGQDVSITTDASALFRVLCNMVLNALEATETGGVVKLWAEPREGAVAFCVWNRSAIPAEVRRRLFQRNFSTKAEAGRGIGTFSMKLLGEDILGGDVSFTSSEADGTVFRFLHPTGEQPDEAAAREYAQSAFP
jgi:signal transduction histidine kinase